MNILDEIESEDYLIGDNNAEPNKLDGSPTQPLHALSHDNEASVSTPPQPNRTRVNEHQSTNGKYF